MLTEKIPTKCAFMRCFDGDNYSHALLKGKIFFDQTPNYFTLQHSDDMFNIDNTAVNAALRGF